METFQALGVLLIIASSFLLSISNGYEQFENNNSVVRQCQNFYRSPNTNCVNKTFNYTDGDRDVKVNCQINCTIRSVQGVTVCKTRFLEVRPNDIFNAVPPNTDKLVIVYDNSWFGYLPQQPHAIELTDLSRLENLTLFYLTARSRQYSQLYPLVFDKPSLSKIKNLQRLAIRMPIIDSDSDGFRLKDIIKVFTNLEILDFSYSRGLGYNSLVDILSVLNVSSVRHLCFKNFQLPGESTFNNKLNFSILNNKSFENLTELDMSYNGLARISSGIIRQVPNLKLLDVSGNKLLDSHNLAFFVEVALHPSIEMVNADYQGFKSSNRENVNDDSGPSQLTPPQENLLFLKSVQFISNCFNSLGSNITNVLTNRFLGCELLRCLLPLEFSGFDCNHGGFPIIRDIFNQDCMMNIVIPVGQHLRKVYFSHIYWEQAQIISINIHGNLCFNSTSSLELIDMSGTSNGMSKSVVPANIRTADGVRGLDNIQVLNVSYNAFDINADKLLIGATTNQFPKLEYLVLSGNNITLESNQTELCKYMPRLKHLELQQVGLKRMPQNLVVNCTKLKKLYIGFNQSETQALGQFVSDLNNLNLAGTTKLRYLDLSNNSFQYLQLGFRSKLDSFKGLTIDLSNNPLRCVCPQYCPYSKPFIEWVIKKSKQKTIRFVGFNEYTCFGPADTKVFLNNIDLNEFWKPCENKTMEIALVIISCILALLFVILCIIGCYKFRWRIRHCVFKCQYHCIPYGTTNENVANKIWKYDTYISFCNEDSGWVNDVLRKKLEQKYGFSICTPMKESNNTSDVIVDEMSKSRQIMLVLSEKSLQDEWCQFEMNQSLRQIQKEEKRKYDLIVIKFGKITPSKVFNSPRLDYILDQHPFIECSMPKFWEHLHDMIYTTSSRGCSICILCCGSREGLYQNLADEEGLPIPEEDEEVIDVDNLPPRAKVHWIESCNARAAARKIQAHITKLENALTQNDVLPDWAYGPVPRPITKVLKNNQDQIDDFVSSHARDKLKLLVDYLKQEKEIEEKKCVAEKMKFDKIQRPNYGIN